MQESTQRNEDANEVSGIWSIKDLVSSAASKVYRTHPISKIIFIVSCVLWSGAVKLVWQTDEVTAVSKLWGFFPLLLYSFVIYLSNIVRRYRSEFWYARGYMYIFEELSSFIAALLVCFVAFFLTLPAKGIRVVGTSFEPQAYTILCITALFLFAGKKYVFKSLTLSFNFNNYLERIKENLTEEYVIKTLQKSKYNFYAPKRNRDYYLNLNKSVDMNEMKSRLIFEEFYKLNVAKDPKKISANLYRWLRRKNRNYVLLSDLRPYFADDDEFHRLTALFRKDETYITEKDLYEFIARCHKNRTDIFSSLEQMAACVRRLDAAATLILMLVLASMAYSNQMITTTGTFTGISALVSTHVIFQGAVRDTFDSIIFLFFIHPYDVGDRVMIDNEIYLVDEMNIYSTVFVRWDGTRVYIANGELRTRPIVNVRRSGSMSEKHRIHVDYNTDISLITQLKKRLCEFVTSNSTDYTDELSINIEVIQELHKIHLDVILQHKDNWQNYDDYLARKTRFLMYLLDSLKKLEIECPPQTQRIRILAKEEA